VPLPPDAHIGEVHLTVSDLNRSVGFYTDVLGFAEVERHGSRAVLGPAGGPAIVQLEGRRDARPRSRRTSGLYHFAILVPDRAALGRSLRRLAEQRWPLTGASDHRVSEALYLDDPDGLGIEVYRDRPLHEWMRSGGELMMTTEPLDLDGPASTLARESAMFTCMCPISTEQSGSIATRLDSPLRCAAIQAPFSSPPARIIITSG
jgi:catechol 2,3-dioxygenase